MAKGAKHRKRTKRNKFLEEGIQDSKPKRDKQVIPLQTKNDRQRQALKAFTERQLIILTGSAGVGKTEIASWWACKQWLAGEVDNIIITRPYKHLGADYGATKGDDAEKLLPFCMSILMKLKKYLGAGILKNNFKMGGFDALFVEADGIQIVPIEKIQGMSFNSRTIIIADELQNATIAQVKSLTTRAEDGCQIICCGDPYQTALKHDNGLDFIEDVIYNHPTEYAEVVEFTKDDVVRGGLAGHLVAAFEEMGKWED